MGLKADTDKVNGGQWTPARFNAFIKSGIRSLTNKWGPRNECRKLARVDRGMYECVGYNRDAHIVTASIHNDKGKRVNNVFVDHIEPVIDPEIGFVSWDEVIKRMFCELDGFQVLCKECHDKKTQDERSRRKKK